MDVQIIIDKDGKVTFTTLTKKFLPVAEALTGKKFLQEEKKPEKSVN